MNKACMYHNHIPLMYIFNSPANECWVSLSFKAAKANISASMMVPYREGDTWRSLILIQPGDVSSGSVHSLRNTLYQWLDAKEM